ncbi:hypothetical protein [Pseudomonas akapageensis]|uniref:hypothetical protein n=1 Tax=Pseudomonas akapageensis TaxID=2609961 RepID=UPI00140B9D5F|nr:hypothetical protein [Pseudomonas akapageensis]
MFSTDSSTAPQLVYLVYGKDTYHQEAVFSIASALAGMRETPGEPLDIQVFSDNAEPYRQLPVRVRPLDETTRQSWSGPHGYHFRAKPVALRKVLDESTLALLIDTDTFFHASPLELFRRIEPGTLLCNAILQRFGTHKTTPHYRYLAPLLSARGLADDQTPLLNSGVIGLHQSDVHVLDKTIELIDECFPLMVEGPYNLEEFCLSVAAYRSCQVRECPDLIHHYWSRKELFRAKIQAWLRKHEAAPLTQEALDDTRLVTAQLPRPPAIQRLGYKCLTVGMPAQQRQFSLEILYGCYRHKNEFDQACAPVWWEKAKANAEKRLGKPLEPQLLERWLNQPILRLALGSQRKVIYQHLTHQQAS